MIVWKILYNSIILPLLWIAFQLLGLFNSKVRRGIEGRRNLFADLERDAHRLQGTSRIWFHSSSMGEFEQAKPIIAVLKKKYPHLDVIVTFFSPSGYEHSKSYKLATIVSYIPFDFASDMKRFIGIIRPTAAVMVRYDVWPNAIWELEKAGIPIFFNQCVKSFFQNYRGRDSICIIVSKNHNFFFFISCNFYPFDNFFHVSKKKRIVTVSFIIRRNKFPHFFFCIYLNSMFCYM